MQRIVVVGLAADHGPLSPTDFAGRLARHLHLPHLPCTTDATARGERPRWVIAEAADKIDVAKLRPADTAVWLNYSAGGMLRGWWTRNGTRLSDALHAFGQSFVAAGVQRVLQEPMLAHLRCHELRTREQANFWLHAQFCRLSAPMEQLQPA